MSKDKEKKRPGCQVLGEDSVRRMQAEAVKQGVPIPRIVSKGDLGGWVMSSYSDILYAAAEGKG